MKFLKIFKNKPLSRIEGKLHSKNSKLRIRASRTSGINTAVHPLKGISINTKHGLRLSKTFNGLTLGFQRGNSIIRGRWSSANGLLNLNLSKSGFSLSTKSKYGTYNFKNPNRSSFKFAGIQLRGKNAKGLALIFSLITLFAASIKLIFMLPIYIFRVLQFLFYILLIFGKIILNILIILSRIILCIYDFIFLILIDIPKQLFWNFFNFLRNKRINYKNLEKSERYNQKNPINLVENEQHLIEEIDSRKSSNIFLLLLSKLWKLTCWSIIYLFLFAIPFTLLDTLGVIVLSAETPPTPLWISISLATLVAFFYMIGPYQTKKNRPN